MCFVKRFFSFGVVPKVRTKRRRLEDRMYSKQQKTKAVKLYIKYGLEATATIRER